MDGDVDYSTCPDADLLEVTRTIDRWKAPLNFANLQRELEARGYRIDVDAAGGTIAVPTGARLSASADAPDALVLAARMVPAANWQRWVQNADNSWRLVGAVEARVGGLALRLAGKRAGMFGIRRRCSIELDLAGIVDVEQHGDAVRFEHQSAEAGRRHATLWFEDVAAAERFAARLPQARTGQFEPVLAERAHFDATLARLSPRTPVTAVVVGLNVAVFCAMAVAGAGIIEPNAGVHVAWGSNFGPQTTGGEWWRLVTSTFLHFGLLHLFFNMWALLTTGPLVERLYGPAAFAFLYLASGVLASLASVAWNPMVNSAGASGAIFGVYGALLALLLHARAEIPRSVLRSLRNSTLFFVLYSLGNGLSHQGIDNAAHVGGLCGGFLLAPLLRRRLSAGGDVRPGGRVRRFVLPVVACAAAILGGAIAAAHRAAASAEVEFTRTLDWFRDGESRAIAASRDLAKQASAGKISDAEFAARYQRDFVAFWDEADARIGPIPLPPSSSMAATSARLRELISSRRKSGRLLVEGLREGDATKLRLANAEIKQMDARLAEWQPH